MPFKSCVIFQGETLAREFSRAIVGKNRPCDGLNLAFNAGGRCRRGAETMDRSCVNIEASIGAHESRATVGGIAICAVHLTRRDP